MRFPLPDQLPQVSVRDIMRMEPCGEYTLARVRELWGDYTHLTALDILVLDIPAKDRLWAVLREGVVPDHLLHEFACRCAEHALSRIDSPDQRSIDAISTKRKWLKGEATDEELSEAWAAAEAVARAERAARWVVPRNAARTVADAAAWAAVGAVARDTAWAADAAAWAAVGAVPRNAARTVADAAAWAAKPAEAAEAARDAERKWQVKILHSLILKHYDESKSSSWLPDG